MSVCTHCATPLPDGSLFCSQCGTPVPGRRPEDPTFSPQGREIFERLVEATEGKYDVIRELGRGGMAVVFLGYQKSLDRQVAIKVLLPLLGYDPEIVERFMREARTQGKLDHPNIIQVYEIYNAAGLTFFTAPYISGESLRTFLLDNPQPPLEKVFRYLTQAADALAYAHRRGVVHRDVKPDNILIDTERDRVILTDFGIAKALAAEKTLTTPGDLLGTPQYMSPEQGEGRQDLDGRADQYSLGLIGYEMLAGQRPLQADNLAELMYKHRFEDPPGIHGLRPDAPRHLLDAITRAMSKDRDERFPTMDAFLTALEGPWEVELEEEYAAGETETTPMPTPGSEATTVRVPTPPGTPRPGPVDRTEPDSTEPTVKTPAPWEAEPTLKTPEPAPMPGPPSWIEPAAAAERGAREAALVGTARRRGVPRPLLFGGGAVVLLVVVLVVFGPLGPQRPSTREEQTPGSSAAVTRAEGEEMAGPDAGGEAVADEPTVGTPPPVAEETTTGAAAPGQQAPAVEAAIAEPVPETSPPEVDRAADPRAQLAMDAARRWRTNALAAGAADFDRARFDALDGRLAAADRLLEGGRHDEARTAYSALILDYRALEEDARQAQPAAAAEEPRNLALEAQARANAARQAALAAGVANVFAANLEALDGRLQQAAGALEQGSFDDARAAFEHLAGEYESLADRVRTEMQTRAQSAQSAMREQRQAAVAAGAEDQSADALSAADDIRTQAIAEYRGEAYATAIALFNEARDAYGELAQQLIAAAATAEAAAEEPAPAAEPAESPDATIRALIEIFRQSFEQEDLDRMGAELYRGPVPDGDARTFNVYFDRANDLRAEATIRDLRVEGDEAVAEIGLDLGFRQSRTGEPGTMSQRFRLRFVRQTGVWRLQQAERR